MVAERATLSLHPDRLLPADPTVRAIARELYAEVEHAPSFLPTGMFLSSGWPKTRPSTTRRRCCSPPTTTRTGCCMGRGSSILTASACRLDLPSTRRPPAGSSGCCARTGNICVERRYARDLTRSSTMFSGYGCARARRQPTRSTTRSPSA